MRRMFGYISFVLNLAKINAFIGATERAAFRNQDDDDDDGTVG